VIPSFLDAQLSTEDHLSDPGFWSTKREYAHSEYVGSAACAGCHATIYSSQVKTSMALTAARASSLAILLSHPRLNFTAGPYNFSLRMQGPVAVYQMNSPTKNLDATLRWAFGTGRVGQSYLFSTREGNYGEARVSYFSSLQDLHFTPDRGFSTVKSSEEAMYREFPQAEVKRCFVAIPLHHFRMNASMKIICFLESPVKPVMAPEPNMSRSCRRSRSRASLIPARPRFLTPLHWHPWMPWIFAAPVMPLHGT
jgi:hypothetical protein